MGANGEAMRVGDSMAATEDPLTSLHALYVRIEAHKPDKTWTITRDEE